VWAVGVSLFVPHNQYINNSSLFLANKTPIFNPLEIVASPVVSAIGVALFCDLNV